MIQICRAEDGQVFQVNASLRDIERTGSLELFLHQETGVEQDAILAYLSDGRRLMNSNVRELARSHDQSIFVFNKNYLDYDLEEVMQDLRVEAPLQSPIEEDIAATPPIRPAQLAASYVHTAQIHHEHINHILLSLHYQHEAIRIASANLDLNVLAIVDTFEGIAAGSNRELDKQALLLSGVEADLELISRVRIHSEFLSPAVRKSIEAGEKSRTLGDYVSNVKMKQVAETCARTHDDLRSRFNQVEGAVRHLSEGADAVRATVATKKLLDDAEACLRRSRDILSQITNCVAILDGPVVDPDRVLQDLRHLDTAHRNEVLFIADTKNAFTRQCIVVLRQISVLNNNMVQIPPSLASLQASFRGKNSFSHIQRLHNMLYAYGATIIEIVRRKEFSRFFYQRAQSILEVMAKLSASERKRRQVYRGELHGQLPFETRGMDDPVPAVDFSPSGSLDAPYSLEREDVDGLLRVLDDLERYAQSSGDAAALRAVRECRAALDKLVAKMDGLEAGFDRIAERSLLSASRISISRRRSIEADQQAYEEVAEQLRAAQDLKAHQEAVFQEERRTLQTDIHKLKAKVQEVEATATGEQERSDRLERELHQVRAQLESEITARRIVEQRNTELSADVEQQRLELAKALSDATEQSKVAESLRQELSQVRADFEDVKALETRNQEKINHLLEEQAVNLRKLEDARSRGEDLESQIQSLRAESEDVHTALRESKEEKDRLLRAQASEHERIIRDHLAEADGDRAVLERQFFELKAVQEHSDRQIKDLRAEVEIANADAVGLREELQRVEHELREARHVERLLRDDLRAGQASQSDFEQRLEERSRLIAQILDVAISFRNSHVKALHAAQTMVAHPSASKQSPNLADSVFSNGMRHSIIGQLDEPSPIDPSDPATALETLRAFDHDHFLEAVMKAGSTIRKWQKQCKEYRERAKGKISFRNFAKGDLALFLPTRNSISKPWAAFNVSFPHYFLQATGHLAEQLKTREWIVARITSITERVVDHQDPTSNPYGLGEGVKYYMLEVEDWTQPSHNKRRVSSRKVSNDKPPKEPVSGNSPPAIPPGPPESEVEESFLVTHPPNSALFPVRTRANSSPSARPSSLSRLLAQATPETPLEPVPQSPIRTPSPTISPPQPSPSQPTGSTPQYLPGVPSPLRPGSRASRLSTTSRFSVSRLPALGNAVAGSPIAKAAPTTALSEEPMVSSSPTSGSADGSPFGLPATPSPDGSVSDGIPNTLLNRRRTTSYHVPKTSPLAASSPAQGRVSQASRTSLTATSTLASLANSWGVAFSRRKKAGIESANASLAVEGSNDNRRTDEDPVNPDPSATSQLGDWLLAQMDQSMHSAPCLKMVDAGRRSGALDHDHDPERFEPFAETATATLVIRQLSVVASRFINR
ncbi:putative autophagy-related protein 11 [Lyophyllum shimeji]|uniref:Autophagy-related protein 11 n=1 Tax=Lyophyllum shimeji TaxID=47721 RepID=A0A9P3UNX4_LYOSH|nr:putative autophagy-related protein 11 [Lyophyllum shimeji]